MLYLIPTAAVIAALLLLLPARKNRDTGRARRRLVMNAGLFVVAAALMAVMAVGAAAEAPEAAAAATATASDAGQGMGFLAAALATGLSCLGAGIAIASTAPAAIGAFSEDPKAFGKALIFVVLGEGVALYGLLISILLINKL
ncbi:ATP synthase subunit C [Anaerotruncus colihominis]|uniref:ATP synthase subunit C n=1 Tax=Anaerotruncus colihominis TaxID=169435 RepID=UPI0018981AC3|nr:ATP synthase subunit C [Anaerotruncus colihominis]HJF56361.1 ATP synthase subunit C [Anaerotruncus colihominis]